MLPAIHFIIIIIIIIIFGCGSGWFCVCMCVSLVGGGVGSLLFVSLSRTSFSYIQVVSQALLFLCR